MQRRQMFRQDWSPARQPIAGSETQDCNRLNQRRFVYEPFRLARDTNWKRFVLGCACPEIWIWRKSTGDRTTIRSFMSNYRAATSFFQINIARKNMKRPTVSQLAGLLLFATLSLSSGTAPAQQPPSAEHPQHHGGKTNKNTAPPSNRPMPDMQHQHKPPTGQSETGMPGMQHHEMGMHPKSFVHNVLHHSSSGTSAEPNSTASSMLMTMKGTKMKRSSVSWLGAVSSWRSI